MTLPPGYRFFRDDALLNIREKETLYCSHCGLLYWKTDEERTQRINKSNGSYVGDNLCPDCIVLIRSRVLTLDKGNRKSCPIKAEEWIYAKHHHRLVNEKDLFIKAKRDYDEQQRIIDISNYNGDLKNLQDHWKIRKCKTIEQLKKKKEILERKPKPYYSFD